MTAEKYVRDDWMRQFIPVWAGQALSLLGSGLVQFSLVWWLTQRTGSATVLATASLVALLPEVVLSPFAGALVDRWNRKKAMLIADSAVALATALLAVLFYAGAVQVWHIFVIMFLRAVGSSFHWTAMQASTSLMVPDKHLARVSGLNQGLHGAVTISAPPLAALLMSFAPFFSILALDVVTAIIAVSILITIQVPQPKATVANEPVTPRGLFLDIGKAMRYIAQYPGMLMIVVMAMLLNFFSSPTYSLLPLLITEHFGGDVWHLSAFESITGIGMVVGGLALGIWGGFRSKVVTALTGLVLQGVAFLLVAGAPSNGFTIALVGMGIGSAMNALVNGPFQALIQTKVAPEMQGRVLTLMGSACMSMMPLSMLIAGPVSDALGIRTWYWVSAFSSIILGAGAFLIPAIMQVENQIDSQDSGQVMIAPQKIGD